MHAPCPPAHMQSLRFLTMALSPVEKGEAARADWAHVFLSVLPTLPLNTLADEARIAAALRSAAATVMARYGASLRRAAVAEWEVRLRVPDGSGAWRLVVSSPTGAALSVLCVCGPLIMWKQDEEHGNCS